MAKQHKAEGTTSAARESADNEIRFLAYQLYCEGGYQDGRDLEYWLEAELRVMSCKTANLRKVA